MARMFAAAAFVLLALLASGANGRELHLASTGATCDSLASLQMTVLWGRCVGVARAECDSVAYEQNTVIQQTELVLADACNRAVAEERVWAMSQAIASVSTKALARVRCNGAGFGCGFAVSSGTAWAESWINVIVGAAAAAIDAGTGSTAFCSADIRATAASIADAASMSLASACARGPEAQSAYREDFAVAIARILVDAFARATAEACGYDSDSSCTGGANVREQETELQGGSGNSTPGQTQFGSTSTTAQKLSPCLAVGKGSCCFTLCPGVFTFSNNPALGKILVYDGGKFCSCPAGI